MIGKRHIDLKSLAESSSLIVVARRTSKGSRKVSKVHEGNKSRYEFKSYEYRVESVVRDFGMILKSDDYVEKSSSSEPQGQTSSSLDNRSPVPNKEPGPRLLPPVSIEPLSGPVPSSSYRAPKVPVPGSTIYVASEQASEKFSRDEFYIKGGSMIEMVSEYKTSFVGLPCDKSRPLVMLFLTPSRLFSDGCQWEPASLVYYESAEMADEVRSFFRKI
eukprot:TRINITY_DN14521_c0_g1_i1.p1 TRINITY_DN14521_c0_g1~~TRINITY_DN14521_c0_g1_i1.p1  ORF type:complete len:217 (-),score=23.89 TRINITY_DN14521_c0_g1_i1:144-794(-)